MRFISLYRRWGGTSGTLTARYTSSSQLAGGAAPISASICSTSRLEKRGPWPVLPVPPPGRTTAHSSPIHVRGGTRPETRQARSSAGMAGWGSEARSPEEAVTANEASCWGSDGGLESRRGDEEGDGDEVAGPLSLLLLPLPLPAVQELTGALLLPSPPPSGCKAELSGC